MLSQTAYLLSRSQLKEIRQPDLSRNFHKPAGKSLSQQLTSLPYNRHRVHIIKYECLEYITVTEQTNQILTDPVYVKVTQF